MGTSPNEWLATLAASSFGRWHLVRRYHLPAIAELLLADLALHASAGGSLASTEQLAANGASRTTVTVAYPHDDAIARAIAIVVVIGSLGDGESPKAFASEVEEARHRLRSADACTLA